MSDEIILTFNAGSSSLKIGLFIVAGEAAKSVGHGKIDFTRDRPILSWKVGEDRHETELSGGGDDAYAAAVEEMIRHVHDTLPGRLVAAGHRIVHGGPLFKTAVLLDDDAIARIESLIPLAPLHQPPALQAIQAVRKLHPDIRQTASFDTAFHWSEHNPAARLAIPRKMHDEGIRRYGFHGLSFRFIAARLTDVAPAVAGKKVVIAHLGSGASLCAIDGGKSRDTSMGFSALDGIPMATRPGWIDPGVLLYLMQDRMSDPAQLQDFLYHHCGLLGVSGISGDSRALLADPSPEAGEAINLFCLRIAGEVARLAATLGGIDALVFTAGVGENQPEIRANVMGRLGWLGLEFDANANATGATIVSSPGSRILTAVIPTDEEQVIADEAAALLARGSS